MKQTAFFRLIKTVALSVSCFAAANTVAAPHDAHFSWFAYEGKDEIFAKNPPPGHFQNPIMAGFYPDPSITRAGDTFYMIHSSFSYFPGIPIFRSTDLVSWEQIGHVLTRTSQLKVDKAGVSRGIFAPAIRYHNGTFYVITTGIDDAGGNFIVTATDPAGPWSDPIYLPEVDGIDPSMFFDDDGKVYITHNGPPPGTPLYDGHRAIWMWEYDPKQKKIKADSQKLLVNGGVDLSKKPIWIEAPHIYKINDWYYLSCAEGGTADQHSQVIFRTRDLSKPFVPYKNNPILTQRDLDPNRTNPIATAGHADIVQTPSGEWWAVFLATRNYNRDFFNTGRDTFLLPVTWKDGWPHILPAKTEIPWQLPSPKGLKPTENGRRTGNFQVLEEFKQPQLGLEWNLLRTSEEAPYSMTGKGVTLHARNVSLADYAQPAFIGRRQQHQSFYASTRLNLPLDKSVRAGITAFQSEQSHYFLGVERTKKGYDVILEQASQSEPKAIKVQSVKKPGAFIDFKIEADVDVIAFYYRPAGEVEWRLLADKLDNTILSTQKAGGFVGTYLGLHARVNKAAEKK